jgi:UDP-N-acetyl-D-mannosaminuronic acid dehydrogenase
MFAKHGLEVLGVDVNPHVIKKLQAMDVHIEEPGLQEMMHEVMVSGRFQVSMEVAEADVFIIAVPTPIKGDKTANVDYVVHAADMILPFLRKGNLVVLESTCPPRTVVDVLLPILTKSGLHMGKEVYVAHSPERVLPGKLIEELVSNARIIGGINEVSSDKAVALYKTFVQGEIHVTDATTAELVKLMENTYRDVNIAFANEMARMAEIVGCNIWEAIDLANCHPRVNVHRPGPGVGGHCIAVDPWFIVQQAPETAQMITLSRQINDSTPHYVAKQVYEQVKEIHQPVVTVLGLAFKGNIDDMRESPSLEVIHTLKQLGCRVKSYDPYVQAPLEGKVVSLEQAAKGSDCLLILTDHQQFKTIDYPAVAGLMRQKLIFDTRNIIQPEQLETHGIECILLGTPSIKKQRV